MTSAHSGAVLITGASSGIGEATALHLDALEFDVFAGVRSEEDARRLSEKASGALRPVFLDVTEEDSIAEAVETVREATGERREGLAGLVNNAGIVVAGPLEILPPEAVRHQLEVNVVGLHAVTRAVLPLLRDGRGRIVNVSSASGRVVTPWTGAYAASKFAVEALSDALRMELRPWKIPVSVIQPGVIDTPVWKRSFDRATSILGAVEEDRRKLYETTLERLERREGRTPPQAIPPLRVAETIARALTARRPKTRYLVAREAWFAALVARLPDRLRDRILSS